MSAKRKYLEQMLAITTPRHKGTDKLKADFLLTSEDLDLSCEVLGGRLSGSGGLRPHRPGPA